MSMLKLITLFMTFTIWAHTFERPYITPTGKQASVKLRSDAVEWVKLNVQGIDLLSPQKKVGLQYITSLFMERLKSIDEKRPIYDELYRVMKPGDVSYSPYFIKEGIKIAIMGANQKLTDYPEYAHWKGKTVEEVFGYPGDHRLMDDIGGEATRNTCFLKENRVGSYPIGSSNTYYHEFGHFLHMTTMTPEEFILVEKLFLNAKARNVFLDDYAAQSVHEYFAQGLEAYISETKTSADRRGRYTKSDRNDLMRLDIDLYQFIATLIETY